jgi:hypothetical protein
VLVISFYWLPANIAHILTTSAPHLNMTTLQGQYKLEPRIWDRGRTYAMVTTNSYLVAAITFDQLSSALGALSYKCLCHELQNHISNLSFGFRDTENSSNTRGCTVCYLAAWSIVISPLQQAFYEMSLFSEKPPHGQMSETKVRFAC